MGADFAHIYTRTDVNEFFGRIRHEWAQATFDELVDFVSA